MTDVTAQANTLTLHKDDVLAEMKHRASSGGCTGICDGGTCCDDESELHPEDWCNNCLMGVAVRAAAEQREQLDALNVAVATYRSIAKSAEQSEAQIATLTDERDNLRRAYETVQDNEFAALSPSTHAQNLAQQVRTLTAENAALTAANQSLDAHCMVLQHDIRQLLCIATVEDGEKGPSE